MNYYFDTRSVGKDGRCPLRLRVRKDGKSAMPLTGIRIYPDKWDEVNNRAKDVRLNQRLRDILDNAEDYILKLKLSGRYEDMTVNELSDNIGRLVLSLEPKKPRQTFAGHLEKYRDRLRRQGTRNLYDWTLRTLGEFDPDISHRSFKEIDFDYLTRLEGWCYDKGMKVNTLSVLMRNIRAVFNDAIKDESTIPYPFRRYKIRTEETRKRSLTIEELRQFMTCKVNHGQERYRDYFMLIIYLIGINTTDLFQARPEDLKNGRLEYQRDKTGKLYSIKVEPEAMAIIEKYRGKDYLLEPMDGHGDFLSWRSQLNKRLKAIGQTVGKDGKILKNGPFSEISTYWARHTWATLAYHIGIPIDIIAQALGHSDRSHAVTFTYIRPDASKVDEANRKVIDYIKASLPKE